MIKNTRTQIRSTYNAHHKVHFLLGATHEAVMCLMIRREG